MMGMLTRPTENCLEHRGVNVGLREEGMGFVCNQVNAQMLVVVINDGDANPTYRMHMFMNGVLKRRQKAICFVFRVYVKNARQGVGGCKPPQSVFKCPKCPSRRKPPSERI